MDKLINEKEQVTEKMRILTIVIGFLSFTVTFSSAQEHDSYDNLMKKMREYTWEKKEYDKAIKIGKELLERYPNNTSLEQFMGNLYFYTNQDSLATAFLEKALAKEPGNMDIANSLYHLKFKQKNYDAAERYVDRLIQSDSTNTDYQIRKVQTYYANGKKEEALSLLGKLNNEYPNNESIKYLSTQMNNKSFIEEVILKNSVGLMYRQLSYSSGIDPKIMISGRYIRKANKATIVATGTYGEQFENKGVLLESELYYNHNKNAYSNALLSWSNKKELFSVFNAGYTYFHNVGKGWVPGAGLRYVYSDNNHTYTALIDVSKYWGKNLSQVRVYGIFDENKFYQAYSFSHRYFFSSQNYVQLMYTLGTSPDDKTRLVEANLDFKAHTLSVFGNVKLSRHFDARGYLNYTKQKISPTINYSIYEFGMELLYNF